MQKTLSKREYDRMRDALDRLTSTTVVATNCFYDNLAKSWVSEAFHLFDRDKLYQERRVGPPLATSASSR
jgi:plasmid replication initiation protein